MPPATFKPSSTFSASRWQRRAFGLFTVAAIALGPRPSFATGGGDDSGWQSYSFFSPEVIDSPSELAFEKTEGGDVEGAMPDELLEVVNRKEWSTYLRGKVSDGNLSYLIYKMKLPELDRLIWTFEGKKSPALGKEAQAVRADLEALGDRAQVLRALYYLGFAKRCEPIATRNLTADVWNAEKIADARLRDAETATKLLAASEGLVASTKDSFLQDRYRFQRLRLMFYTRRYPEAQSYYTAQFAAFSTDSSVKYRFLHTAAGAFFRDKQYGRANYLYSLVFDRFAPLRRTSYMSFRPVEEADWKESLSLAKSDRERLVIWQLLGLYTDGAAAIENIYRSAPDSNLLPLLLVREMRRAEADWSQNLANRRDAMGSGAAEARSDAEAVGKRRVALIKRIADGKKSYKPYLWQLALGHLYALGGDSRAALAMLDQAERSLPKSSKAATQLRISRLFARVRGMKALDKAQEPMLAVELKWLATTGLDGSSVGEWCQGWLSGLYQKGGDPLRARLLAQVLPPTTDAQPYPDNRQLDQLLGFLAQPGPSPFDQYLASTYRFRRDSLIELQALNDLYAGRWKSASDRLGRTDAAIAKRVLAADPFHSRVVDCIDCDEASKRPIPYDRLGLIKRLDELSQAAQRPGSEGAQASFQLASGLYSVSYYGNARGVALGEQASLPHCPGSGPNCKMELVEKYAKRAMELAPDKELAAQACFLAAKAEQNRFFNAEAARTQSSRTVPAAEPVHSPVYFKKLKQSYADTRYYQEIIRECGYFRSYLGKK